MNIIMKQQVYITDYGFPDLEPEQEVLQQAGFDLHPLQCKSRDELISKVSSADALMVQWAPVDEQVIDALEQCKVIVRYGIGVDNVDLSAAKKRNIAVCNVPDYCVKEVADHTIALALTALRQIIETDKSVREGNWSITLKQSVSSYSETNFCLAGFGRIAREVASRAQALGFRVSAYDPYIEPSIMLELGVIPVSLDRLLENADILSLHLPLSAETKYFINAERLKQMRSNAVLINTSRGGLIDSVALAEALSNEVIWKAALDVFEQEPLPADDVLRTTPNVILSSHVAWFSRQSIPLLQRKAAEEVVRALRGEPLMNRVV